VVTGARSTNTVQGHEWRAGEYRQFFDNDVRIKKHIKTISCDSLMEGLTAYERPQFLWAETKKKCFQEPYFRPVFRNAKVTIYELMPGALPRPAAPKA
jgi:hypothetical protein